MFEHGAESVKCDLHVHTKSEITKYTDRKHSDQEYAVAFVQAMKKKDISIAAITNHNLFSKNEYLEIKKEATKNRVLVLPGVEVSLDYGKGGIHVLVIFPDDCADEEDGNAHCALERFLTNMYPERQFDEDYPVKRGSFEDMVKTLDRIKKPYMLIPAHVDNDKGFFKELRPGTFSKFINDCWMRKRIMAFQGINESSKDVFIRMVSQKAREYSCSESSLIPAFIEASDARSLQEIGNQYFEIKIGELSFESLHFALSLHSLRMEGEKVKQQYSWIKRVSFDSNKILESVNVPLNKNLNTLVGVRGSGKSTIIEAIRYAFEIDAKKDAPYKEGLLRELLGSGNEVIVDLMDKAGGEYQIRRTLNETAKVYQNEEYKPGLRPQALWNISYYGQKDLQDMVEDTSRAVAFIDSLIHKDLIKLTQCENSIKEELRDLFRRIDQVERKLNKKKEYEEKLALAEKVIDDFKRRNIADKLKIEADYNRDKVRLEQHKATINKVKTAIVEFSNQIYELIQKDITAHSSHNKCIFSNINETTVSFTSTIDLAISSMMKEYDKYTAGFDKQYSLFLQKQEGIKEEIAKIKREIDIKDLSLDDYSKNVGIREKMTILLKEVNRYNEERQNLLMKKNLLMNKLQHIWQEAFRMRQNMAKRINSSQELVSIDVEYKGNKPDFSRMLKGVLTGTRISAADRDRVISSFSDGIEILNELHKDCNKVQPLLSDISYPKFCESCTNSEYELLTYRVPDAITINYQGKDIRNLSLGQRASAMIMLILELSEEPIIMDQPEDDLDNQMIYEGLVKELWEQKGKRQIVFATHNSNIPVLGDCEQGCVCSIENHKMQTKTGSIDTYMLKKAVVDIMEGGKDAFQRRKEVYEKWI